MSQSPRSARRDHGLVPFASSRIADAAAVGLNAPKQAPKVRLVVPPTAPKVRRTSALATLAAVASLIALTLPSFAAADTAPTVTLAPIAPADVNFNSAAVSGTVNPEGGPSRTEWFFEDVKKADAEAAEAASEPIPWNITSPFGEFREGEGAEGTTPITVPAEPGRIESLAPGTAYLVRLVATNEGGANTSATEPPQEIETEPVDPPIAHTPVISAVTTNSFHISAAVNSGGTKPGEASNWSVSCSPECPQLQGTAVDGASPPEPVSGQGSVSGHTTSGEAVEIELNATGLEPHTTYTVTVGIGDAAGLATEVTSESETTTAIAPTVETTALTGYVSPTGARFLGEVDPNNSQIQSCLFEYGITTAYGHSVPCQKYPEAEEAEHGNALYTVGAEAQGLAPETEYHYRLLVDNGAGGPTGGGDRTLTTPPAPASQDQCPNEAIRIEQGPAAMALPQCMAYELVSPAFSGGESPATAASGLDGDHAWLYVAAPISGEQISGNTTNLAAIRGSQGWALHDLSTAGEISVGLLARSPDSSRVLVQACEQTGTGCNISLPFTFERVESGGERTLMLKTPVFPGAQVPIPQGASDDLSRLLIGTNPEVEPPLLPIDTHTQGHGLYVSDSGALEFLGLDPEGHVLPCGEILANNQSRSIGLGTGFEQNGLSADGRTVFFESPDPNSGCPEPVDLYLRRDGHTVDISAPTNGNPDLGATYVGNTRDGNTVYFVTTSQLVASDTDELLDLYSYDVGTENVSPITTGAGITTATGGPGVVVSPEGNYVYFAAARAIAGATGGPGTDGAQNLFFYHAGQIRRIATTARGFFYLGKALGSGQPSISTPDGRHLLFESEAQLTGQPTGQELQQFFQYDASTDSIACITCRPDGGVPTKGAGILKVEPSQNVDQRLQSDDGRSVLFETGEALLPQDTNGLPDVYLWREGKLHLLGAGHSQSPANVVGTTPDGGSVFFRDTENLIATPIGAGIKVYVARVDGGFPAPQAIPTCESAELCHGPSTAAPAGAAAGTATLVGPPNPKAKHKKKHHHKKHKKKHHKKKSHQRAASHKRGGRQ